jgi:hypothetical protein
LRPGQGGIGGWHFRIPPSPPGSAECSHPSRDGDNGVAFGNPRIVGNSLNLNFLDLFTMLSRIMGARDSNQAERRSAV